MRSNGNHALRAGSILGFAAAIAAGLTFAMAAAAAPPCGICGKNLVKNPGAELGLGVMSVDAFGAVPGWTLVAGQFGAASYKFGNGWFGNASKGPKARGKNYFFGGTTRTAVEAPASIGTQVIALPRKAIGKKATLSAWLGNYGNLRSQVRAEFMDAAGTILSMVKLGPVVTIGGSDMGSRTRSGVVPANTTQVTVVITFAGPTGSYKLAGVDNVSLVLG